MKSIWEQIVSIFSGEDTDRGSGGVSNKAEDGSISKAISKGKNSPGQKTSNNLYSKVKKAATCERKKALNSKITDTKSTQETSTDFTTPDRRVIK